ncbi:MAG: efflux RND transporter permease subunit, partial [Bacillota bacterium]|nr:efflux RND transporter permease subunit [Bacillota bacterium]
MLTKYSIKKPFTIFVAVVVVAVFGFVAVYKMTPDLLPSIDTPYVVVATTYPVSNSTPVDKPVEKQLATLSNIKNVTSISADNYSIVSLEFTDDVNMDAISVDIRDKIDQIETQFPDMASTPLVLKINLDMMPVTIAAVGVKDKTPAEVSTFVKEKLQSSLEGTEGVASVSYVGMIDEGVQIVLSQDKIDAVNEKVQAAIRNQFNKGEGQLKSGISKAKNGSKAIDKGKDQIKNGQADAAAQYDSAISMAKSNKEQREESLKALEKIDNPTEEQKQEMANLKATIKALDTTISDLQSQKESLTFDMSTSYSDISGQKGTIDAVVSKLQGTLAQIESQKQAAIDSADMTGVITQANVSAILGAQNFEMPAGYVSDGRASILVSVGDKIKSVDEMEDLVLFDLGIDGLDPI